MSITGHQPQKPIMVIATPRSGSTLFTRCLSKAIGASALHEPQMSITENNLIMQTAMEKSSSDQVDDRERQTHSYVYKDASNSEIEKHLKGDAGKYPIRKEMTAFTALDVCELNELDEYACDYDYNTAEMRNLISQKYFQDISDQCARSASPIILICANPVDIMHSIFRSLLEDVEGDPLSKEDFNHSIKYFSEIAKSYYENHLKLKKTLEERQQPYVEITREQVLGDLTGTVNHVIEACGLSGEATDELTPVKLYDNSPPSPDIVEYTLSNNDTFVSKHERSHNRFIPRTETQTLSERLREVIAEKCEDPVDDLMALVKEGEEEVREFYQGAEA